MDRTDPTERSASISAIEIKFRRQNDTGEEELKAWAIRLEQDDEVKKELGRLIQPVDNEHRRNWTLVRGKQRGVVGDSKLAAIAQVKAMFANLVPAPEPKPSEQPTQQARPSPPRRGRSAPASGSLRRRSPRRKASPSSRGS